MDKRLANLMEPEAQASIANRLRQFADALDSGKTQLTDCYVSQNVVDTTEEGAKNRTCELDPTSGLLLLRYVVNERGSDNGGNLERYLRDELAGGKREFRLVAEERIDGSLTFYIHPLGADGTTRDFEVRGNLLRHAAHILDTAE